MTDTYPLRPVTDEELPALYAVGEQAFNSSWPSGPGLALERITFEAERSLAAFDGSRVVGSAAAYTFQMTIPGGSAAAAGVSWVSVLPSHRRRGILSAMMRHQLADIAGRGEAIAVLYSSESSIYGRFGYGMASQDLKFSIRRAEGRLLPQAEYAAADGDLTLRLAEPKEAKLELAKVYDTVLASRPGMMAKDDRWWQVHLADPEFARDGASPMRCLLAEDATGVRGYALYNGKGSWADGLPAAEFDVFDLLATDPAAYAALWTDLLTRDLLGELRAWRRPMDDPLLHLLADSRRSRARIIDGLWVRLVDVPAALTRRQYARDVDVVIEVTDDLLPQNQGRWRLQASAATGPAGAALGGTAPGGTALGGTALGGTAQGGRVRCERSTAAADIRLPVRALGSAYLGGIRLTALADAGQLAELRPGALTALSTAMSWDRSPWNTFVF